MNRHWSALLLTLAMVFAPVAPTASLAVASAPVAAPKALSAKTALVTNQTVLDLTLGKAQVIKLSSPAIRVSNSNPETVGIVLISPSEIQLVGKAIGVANLLIWSGTGSKEFMMVDLTVHRDVSALARKIKAIDPGIQIAPIAAEDAVILTGLVENPEKAQLAYDLTKAFFASPNSAGSGASSSGAGAAMGAAAGAAGSSSSTTSSTTASTSSDSAGSATFAQTSTKIINLIRVVGQPSTKAESVQAQLKVLDEHIKLVIMPGYQGAEKAILTGRVKNGSVVTKAVNLTSIFYGAPGIKVLNGPGGNLVTEAVSISADSGTFEAGTGAGLINNSANNILHGSVVTDTSGNVISMLEIEERPQVKCTVKILEVQKTAGLNLTSSFRALGETVRGTTYSGTTGSNSMTTFFNQVSGSAGSELGVLYGGDFASLLQALVTDNKAKVLAEPTISTNSGEPANFLAGGEFPVPVSNVNGQVTVTYRQFGIQLNLLPTVTDKGTIHMQVSPEVSSLDPQAGITINGFNIPGLRTRRSRTVLEMRDGQYFVLSGLYNEDMTDVVGRTPILGQIPILGALFSSKAYQKKQTEMIIVIHPEIDSQMNLSNLENTPPAVGHTTSMGAEAFLKQYQADRQKEQAPVTSPVAVPAKKSEAPPQEPAQKPDRLSWFSRLFHRESRVAAKPVIKSDKVRLTWVGRLFHRNENKTAIALR